MSIEQQFLQFADLRPEALLLVSGTGTILAANRSVQGRLGVAPQALVGRPLQDFVPSSPETLASYLRACSRSRDMVIGSLNLQKPDGQQVACRAEGAVFRPVAAGSESIVLLCLVPREEAVSRFVALTMQIDSLSREIVRRKKVEQELRDQREWLQVTLASIGDAVIATDTEGNVVFLNPAAEKLTGWLHKEAMQQPLEQVFHILNEQTRLPAENPVVRVLQEGVTVGLANHTILLDKKGSERPVDDCAAPIRDEVSRIIGTVLVFHDVSDRRRMERELSNRADALAEAASRKDAFLAMLAHELRNPLAPVLNSVHLLRKAGDDPTAWNLAVETLERQTQHMSRLVDGLVEATRLLRGRVPLHSQRLDLARLVRTTAEDRRNLMEQAELTMTVTTPQTPVWVKGDATRLSQALDNLLDNAARFTDRGGRVEVRLAVKEALHEAVITINDTGIGIGPDLLPHLFTVFGQADLSLDRSRGGLGLGLFLVRGLIDLHGGRVEASSMGQGRGSEFTIRLPVEREPAALAGPSPCTGNWGSKTRVLVIEDNRDSADSLKILLQMLGHEVQVAYSGPDGLTAARTWMPEVVISDIGLPGLDGYAVAEALRKDPATAGTLLIGVSGYGREEDVRRAREAGFNHYLTKPASPEELQRLVTGGRG